MSEAFRFDPKALEAVSSNQVEIIPISARPEDERLKFFRARGIMISKRSDTDPIYGFGHHESYWTVFAGPQTSEYDANVLVAMLGFLHEPRFMEAKGNWIDYGLYDSKLGAWVRKSHAGLSQVVATIDEVKQIVDARIAELGLSKVLLAEFYSQTLEEQHGSIAGEAAWNRLEFSSRMERFRVQSGDLSHERPAD